MDPTAALGARLGWPRGRGAGLPRPPSCRLSPASAPHVPRVGCCARGSPALPLPRWRWPQKNRTIHPWGGVCVCEDRSGHCSEQPARGLSAPPPRVDYPDASGRPGLPMAPARPGLFPPSSGLGVQVSLQDVRLLPGTHAHPPAGARIKRQQVGAGGHSGFQAVVMATEELPLSSSLLLPNMLPPEGRHQVVCREKRVRRDHQPQRKRDAARGSAVARCRLRTETSLAAGRRRRGWSCPLPAP